MLLLCKAKGIGNQLFSFSLFSCQMLLDVSRCLCSGWGQAGAAGAGAAPAWGHPPCAASAQVITGGEARSLNRHLSTDVLLCRGSEPTAASSEAWGTRSNMHNPTGKLPMWGGELRERWCDKRGCRVMSQSWVPHCPAEMGPTGSVAWKRGAEEGFRERCLELNRGGRSVGT